MASLWKQRTLVRSFSAYFWAPEQIKFYEKTIEEFNEDTELQRDIKRVMNQAFQDHVEKMHKDSKDHSISEEDLITFHYYFGVSKWQFVKRWKRRNILKKSVFQKLREDSKSKDILEECKKNGYLVSKGEYYVTKTALGGKLEQKIGWLDETLKRYSSTQKLIIGLLSGSIGTLLILFCRMIYHWFLKG